MSFERPKAFKPVCEIPPIGSTLIVRRIVQIGGEYFEIEPDLEQAEVVTRSESAALSSAKAGLAGCVIVSNSNQFAGEPRIVPFMDRADVWGQLPAHALMPGMVAVHTAFETTK